MALKPDQVTAESVEQAKAELLTDIKAMATQARRVYEIAAGLAQQTGRPEDRAAADRAANALTELDNTINELLKAGE